MNILYDRAAQPGRIILFGFFTEAAQLIGAIINPPDKRHLVIHHHQLAMQATEHVHPKIK